MAIIPLLSDLSVVKELTPRTLALFFFMSIGAINFGFGNTSLCGEYTILTRN